MIFYILSAIFFLGAAASLGAWVTMRPRASGAAVEATLTRIVRDEARGEEYAEYTFSLDGGRRTVTSHILFCEEGETVPLFYDRENGMLASRRTAGVFLLAAAGFCAVGALVLVLPRLF